MIDASIFDERCDDEYVPETRGDYQRECTFTVPFTPEIT